MRLLALVLTLALLTVAPGATAQAPDDPNCGLQGRVSVCQEGYYCDFERGVCGYEWLCVYVGARGTCVPWAPSD